MLPWPVNVFKLMLLFAVINIQGDLMQKSGLCSVAYELIFKLGVMINMAKLYFLILV